MCVDPNTGAPVHRVVLPGKIGAHALRALIGDFSCHVHYTPVNHGGRMDATMITGVDGTMLEALKTSVSGLFAPGLMMTKMVVEAKVPTHDGVQSRLFVAYTWVFDLRDQEVMSLLRMVDNKPALDPPQDWMQPAMRNCPEARRLLQSNHWMFWMRVYLVVGKTLPPPPDELVQIAQPEPMKQANLPTPQDNLPMGQTNFPMGQTAFPMEQAMLPTGPAYRPEAQTAIEAAAVAAKANRQAPRLREHRAAILLLKRRDRRAADRKGKGVDRRIHPGLHPGLLPQGPEASPAAGSGLRHMVGQGLGPATEANVSDHLSGSLHPDTMLRENANADAFLVDPSIDLYRSDAWKDFVAAGQRMALAKP
ncbi:hypothetical protein CPLU01_13868 [Colletotrichum plurivorum]|uniref:Uncharacterized protein n=1 Tax=Colletotrichum plurivorum TaxID=2175906 RepID=A0A8H6JPF0_9PEZI|nr:hypothetical protein CPLU01_13868 [Colletotrichum plurivorum]